VALDKARENHNGPKRGKGHWGTKKEAKTASRRKRRQHDAVIKKGLTRGDPS
jgi:hypothetical protein